MTWPKEVFEDLRNRRSDHAVDEVLVPWLERDGAETREVFQRVAAYDPAAVGDETPVSLAWLYGMSRINNVLLLGFQPPFDDSSEPPWAHRLHLENSEWPAVSRQDYLDTFTALGMTEITSLRFDPFLHEIVAVEQAEDPAAPIEVTEVVWPGLMVGEMLFSRAGVRIRAGADQARAGVADLAPLHFEFVRRHRATFDLSLGWGHASQWDTDFRRDYRTADGDHLNVDGTIDLEEGAEPGDADLLTPAECRVLLRNRCLLTPPELSSTPSDWAEEFCLWTWRLTVPREEAGS